MLYKSAGEPATATDDGAAFTGYASTWTKEPDCYGDIVAKGAFSRTLKEWQKKGTPIPVLWSHYMDEPKFFIGHVQEAIEDDHGLKVTCKLDDESETAQHVRRLLKTGTVGQMSFAFDIREDATVEISKDVTARELRDVALYEVSVVPYGANKDTSIEDVKAAPPASALTVEEIAQVRDLLASRKTAPEEGATDGNTGAIEAREGKRAARTEAAARLNTTITALIGQEGEAA